MTKAFKASSRTDGTASDTMLKLGHKMGSLLTTGTMTPSELVELMFEAATSQYGVEVKPDGSVWNEAEAKGRQYYLEDWLITYKALLMLTRKNYQTLPLRLFAKNSQYVSEMDIDYKKS
ncbi:hypothetical protein [Nostoc sp.]